MSYTSQKVIWEQNIHNPLGDQYGDISYRIDTIRARKQPMSKVVQTSDGRELLAKDVYYVDPYVEPKALTVSKMDRLDGNLVEDIYVMVGLNNKPRMLRFITV